MPERVGIVYPESGDPDFERGDVALRIVVRHLRWAVW
jgi:hypothetical protein